MRLLLPIATALAATASAQPVDQPLSPVRNHLMQPGDCPSATNQMAGKGSLWRRESLRPRKLGELPPADSYAAVYQRDERGCIVPVMYPAVRAGRR